MAKTRNLFKKIGHIREVFHAKIDMIKEREGKELQNAELRWGKRPLELIQMAFLDG